MAQCASWGMCGLLNLADGGVEDSSKVSGHSFDLYLHFKSNDE